MSVSMRVSASEWAGQRECMREINNCANQLHLESSLRLGCHGISKQRFPIFRDGRVLPYKKGNKHVRFQRIRVCTWMAARRGQRVGKRRKRPEKWARHSKDSVVNVCDKQFSRSFPHFCRVYYDMCLQGR